MSDKKTISIPSALGSTNLSESFGKISFSNEMKELLSALQGEIIVHYRVGAEKPEIKVVDSKGKSLCSLDEFKALSGYRRFVSSALKEADKVSSTDEKVKMISFFVRCARDAGCTIPARIVEQNLTKFNQFGAMIQVVENNLKVIKDTIDNEWKEYLSDMGSRVIRLLYGAQILCTGSSALDKEFIGDNLLDLGVPKWLYNKFLDRNFTSNLKNDCITVLFPKNNYLKAIALSTRELKASGFITKNNLVLQKSGGMIALSNTDFSVLFPKFPSELKEQVYNYVDNYQWICTNPVSSDEILKIRESGKMAPIFREAMPPRMTGKNSRPETEVAKVCRNIGNLLGQIQTTWNAINNFVIPVANPITEFWVELFEHANDWDVSPTNTIYNCIRQEKGFIAILDKLRNCSIELIIERIALIVSQSIRVPPGTKDFEVIKASFVSMLNKSEVKSVVAFNDKIDKEFPLTDLKESMKKSPPTDDDLIRGKALLGIREKKKEPKRSKNGISAVRLHTRVLNELSVIKEESIYEPVTNWLMTTFKTGNKGLVQMVAAERVLGEILKNQGEVFAKIEDEDLGKIEEYYDTDSDA